MRCSAMKVNPGAGLSLLLLAVMIAACGRGAGSAAPVAAADAPAGRIAGRIRHRQACDSRNSCKLIDRARALLQIDRVGEPIARGASCRIPRPLRSLKLTRSRSIRSNFQSRS